MAEKKKPKEDVRLPELTIGICGHVDHGKTTLLEKLSGKWTDTHSEEIKRGITIRLGYADTTFYHCGSCEGTKAFGTQKKCRNCESESKTLRSISFVDAPGHESLMATMLSGAAIMDGALVLVAANEPCPQPQTSEHIMALSIVGIKNVVIVQNKIDLVDEKQALANYQQIRDFLANTPYKDAPIIPISAQYNVNMDALVEAIQEAIPTPERDTTKSPVMLVARSFDINKPGSNPDKIVGGVLGGILKQGILKKGQTLEIRPGYEVTEKNQKVWKPLTTRVENIVAGNHSLEEVRPGGSFGILTTLDPSIIKSDSLVGSLVGPPGTLPPTLKEVKMKVTLLQRVVGSKKDLEVDPIKPQEVLMLNVNSAATVGAVAHIAKDMITVKLKRPICADNSSRITISRLVEHRFRLIGYGIIA